MFFFFIIIIIINSYLFVAATGSNRNFIIILPIHTSNIYKQTRLRVIDNNTTECLYTLINNQVSSLSQTHSLVIG